MEVPSVNHAFRIDHPAFAVSFAGLEPAFVDQCASAIDGNSPALHDFRIFQPLTFVDFSTIKDSDWSIFELIFNRLIDWILAA